MPSTRIDRTAALGFAVIAALTVAVLVSAGALWYRAPAVLAALGL